VTAPAILAVGPERLDRLIVGAAEEAERRGWRWRRRIGQPLDLVGDRELAEAEVLLTPGASRCDRMLFAAAPRLRAIVSPVIGVEGIDLDAAAANGVVVCNSPIPENFEGVAEGTILLILAALYDLPGKMRLLSESRPAPAEFEARMLWRKTVGLVGYGRIAEGVARRLAGWDLRLLAHTRSERALPPHVESATLDDLLRESDVVVLLTGLNPETHHLIDEAMLAQMKPDVLIVNTARGAVADETALVRFARANPAARLALDVFETEPLPADSPLRDLPNAILTPHAIAGTREALVAIRHAAIENVAAVIAGAPRNVCNPQVLNAWRARWPAPTAA
jgi:phosphoglycerate dehydrogenase-like enzyme